MYYNHNRYARTFLSKSQERKKEPILNLGMKLGEASGGAIAALIIKASLVTHNKMATFNKAGVSKKS